MCSLEHEGSREMEPAVVSGNWLNLAAGLTMLVDPRLSMSRDVEHGPLACLFLDTPAAPCHDRIGVGGARCPCDYRVIR